MDFRTRRQLAVIVIVLAAAGAVASFAFWAARPAPACTDGRRNQGEEEADCGGPCIPCAFRHRQDIEIAWTRLVKVRANTYDVAAQIRNPNVKLAARTFIYEIRIYDTNGVLQDVRRASSYLYPGETAHLVEAGFVSSHDIRNADLGVSTARWVLANTLEPDLIAGNREYAAGEGDGQRGTLRALVTNRSARDISGITVSVVVANAAGNLLGASRSVIDRLGPNETKPVKWSWPAPFAEPIGSIEIEARSPDLLPFSP